MDDTRWRDIGNRKRVGVSYDNDVTTSERALNDCSSPRCSLREGLGLAWDKRGRDKCQKQRIDKQPYGDLRSGQKVVLESPYAEAEGSPASRKSPEGIREGENDELKTTSRRKESTAAESACKLFRTKARYIKKGI